MGETPEDFKEIRKFWEKLSLNNIQKNTGTGKRGALPATEVAASPSSLLASPLLSPNAPISTSASSKTNNNKTKTIPVQSGIVGSLTSTVTSASKLSEYPPPESTDGKTGNQTTTAITITTPTITTTTTTTSASWTAKTPSPRATPPSPLSDVPPLKTQDSQALLKQREERKKQREKEPIENYYIMGEKLGSGAFSVVYEATDRVDQSKWAVKVISKGGKKGNEEEAIQNEISILLRIDHQNAVRLREVFQTQTNYYLVLEKISGGELFDLVVQLQSYSETDARKVMRQIFLGIQHLHQNFIVHRDLKPENLLLSERRADADVKITDFGLSAIFPDEKSMKMKKAVGTPGYLAPEVLVALDGGPPYGKEVDLFAAGVIMYILLSGFPPFYGDDDEEIYCKTETGNYDFPEPPFDEISSSARDLIKRLLVIKPQERLTVEQALNHAWFHQDTSTVPLKHTIEELKRFNARKRFKGAVNAVRALSKMKGLSGSLISKLRSGAQKQETNHQNATHLTASNATPNVTISEETSITSTTITTTKENGSHTNNEK